MTRVDIAADLNSEDETGFVWTFLDEADDPSLIRQRQLVVAGSGSTSAVCEVIDLEERPAGTVVHRPCPARNDRAVPTSPVARR